MISMLLIGVFFKFQKSFLLIKCSPFIPKIGKALHVDSLKNKKFEIGDFFFVYYIYIHIWFKYAFGYKIPLFCTCLRFNKCFKPYNPKP
jgi:hypothetical protein